MNKEKNKLIEIYFYVIIFLKILELTVILPEDNIINIIMVAVGLLLLLYVFIKSALKIEYKYPKELKIYLICIIITFMFNCDMRTLKSVIFQIFYVAILFLLAQKCVNKRIYKNINIIILITTFVVITIFYIQYMIYGDNVLFTNINGGGLLVALNIFILFFAKRKDNHVFNIGKWGLIIYYAIFMLVFGSRTSLISLIIVFAIILLKRFLAIKYMKSIVIFTIILVGTFAIFQPFEQGDFQTKITLAEEKINRILSNRYYLWKYSIYNLENKFLFGIGADLEGKIIEKMPDSILSTLSRAQKNILSRSNVHNGYIQILVQNGVVGLALIVILLYRNVKLLKYQEESKYLLIFFISINLCENVLLLSNSLIVLLIWMNLGIFYREYDSDNISNEGEIDNERKFENPKLN